MKKNVILQDRQKTKIPRDLMLDPQVRAVIKENLFRGMLVRPIVVTFVVITFWYQVVRWPEPPFLIAGLAAWWFNSFLYFILYFYHRAQPLAVRQQANQSTWYLRLLVLNCWLDSACLGVVALALFKARADWELMIVVGTIMYMFSAFIKNQAYATAARYLPALVFTPMTVTFLIMGDAGHITIAVYFIISMVSLAVYGATAAASIQLPIKQRFELEELTFQLNLERNRADAANAAKSHFFTAASHDARQPLQAISLLFQSFQKSSHANLHDKKIIEKIDINLKTIRRLFDRVLDISRIDSGNVTPQLQAFSLQTLFDKLDAQFGELAASKGLWLRFVPTDTWVVHDSELLDRIVSNLVDNAIKYTPTGGVWVAWRETRGRLEVRDSGLGIRKGDHQTIFNEFAQVNNPARNNEAGLGLGLSIVKRLADLTHTPLGLNSKPAHGSTFWLKLNTESPDLQVNSSLKPVTSHIPSSTASGDTNKPLTGLHIFYVDDEPQLRELFTELLTDAGATVDACSDVDEAKLILASIPFAMGKNIATQIDIVLTDYRLGASGTGLDVVEAVRTSQSQTNGAMLPAVLLTGDSAVKDLIAIQQLSNSTLLHKPVDFEQLIQTLLKAVKAPLQAKL